MAHHEPFKALGPVEWDSLDRADLGALLDSAFANAKILVNSIPPAAASGPAASPARARATTEPPPLAGPDELDGPAAAAAQQLRKEWKDVKVSGPENPAGAVRVYKLAAKDGKGSWFARTSRHEGLPFEKWRLGLEREFAESLRASSGAATPGLPGGAESPLPPPASAGTGIVRSIGAERRVEREIVKVKGMLETYQLSARFPGPTTPRDFVVVLLTTPPPGELPQGETGSTDDGRPSRPPRQYMIVSKPCIHPACPPRQGFIRGQYESVEIIREVPVSRPRLRKTRSSVELRRGEDEAVLRAPQRTQASDDVSRKAILRSAERAAGGASPTRVSADDNLRGTAASPALSISSSSSPKSDLSKAMRGEEEAAWAGQEPEMAIEWIMVTRSDPGGSVPRFMVEKGTPGGIVADTGRFIRWLESKTMEELAAEDQVQVPGESWKKEQHHTPHPPERKSLQERRQDKKDALSPEGSDTSGAENKISTLVPVERPSYLGEDEVFAAPATGTSGGFYDMIAGALGAAGTVASRMASFALPARSGFTDEESSDISDASSISSSSQLTFASAAGGSDPDLPISLERIMKGSSDVRQTDSAKLLAANASPEVPSQDVGKPPSSREASVATSDAPTGSAAEDAAPAPSPMTGISKQHERELQKLQERRQKVLDKMARAQERAVRKGRDQAEKQKQKSNKKKHQHQHHHHSNNSSSSIPAAAANGVAHDGASEQARHSSAIDSSNYGANGGDEKDPALAAHHGDQNHDKKAEQQQQQQQQKDALARLHEKHERERAKQEGRYLREVRRLEEKRAAEERKAEERRRRKDARERETATRLELEKAYAERDVALKEMEMLRAQVGALQSQNTMLVARLGKLGARVSADGSEAGGHGSGEEEGR